MKAKKSRADKGTTQTRQRILFFDIIRILCVGIIVYDHSRWDLIPGINQFFFPEGSGPFNIYTSGLQGYAVFGMILVSGAVIEYNYQGLEKLHGYLTFLFRRFIRLYPAFWMSLILGLILTPALWSDRLPGLIFEFTGFFVILGLGLGNINIMGWFIATMVCLYLLFPLFSKIIRDYGIIALAGFCIMSWGLRFLIITYNIVPLNYFWRWFPLCNAFEFCLGIYIVQKSLFPKTINTSPIIRELSDVSYYVFLFHILIIGIFSNYLLFPLGRFDVALALNNAYVADLLFYLQMMATVLIASWVIMKIDTRFRSWILQRDAVRNFLQE